MKIKIRKMSKSKIKSEIMTVLATGACPTRPTLNPNLALNLGPNLTLHLNLTLP